MAILQVRDFPDGLYDALTAYAHNENRSISQQTIYFLKRDLDIDSSQQLRRKQALNRMIAYAAPLGQGESTAAELIREDRGR